MIQRNRSLALIGAKERLWLFKANLLDEESFVVYGCVGILYTACPVSLAVSDPQIHPITFLSPLGKVIQSIYCSNFSANMVNLLS